MFLYHEDTKMQRCKKLYVAIIARKICSAMVAKMYKVLFCQKAINYDKWLALLDESFKRKVLVFHNSNEKKIANFFYNRIKSSEKSINKN